MPVAIGYKARPTQRFGLYTEVDPNSRITIADDTVSFAALQRDETAGVYYDFGASNTDFDANINIYGKFVHDGGTAGAIVWMCTLTNIIDDVKSIDTALGDAMGAYFYMDTTNAVIRIDNLNAGTFDGNDQSLTLTQGKDYWYRLYRLEGATNFLKMDIYTDIGMEDLFDSLSMSPTAQVDYRYLYAINTHNSGSTETLTGSVSDIHVNKLPEKPPFWRVGSVKDSTNLKGPHDIQISGNYAYVAGKYNSFTILDITDPFNPSVEGQILTSMTNAQTVLLDTGGNYCFVGTDDGFHSVNITTKTAPFIQNSVTDANLQRINGMDRIGDYVFCANKNGYINVIDVSTPSAPTLYGNFDTDANGSVESPHDLVAWDDYVIVPNQSDAATPKARIYKVFSGGSILALGSWVIEGSVFDADMNGANRLYKDLDNVYIACNKPPHTVAVVDVSDVSAPTIESITAVADEWPDGSFLDGKVLYIGADQTLEKYTLFAGDNSLVRVAAFYDPEVATQPGGNHHDLVKVGNYIYTTYQEDDTVAIYRDYAPVPGEPVSSYFIDVQYSVRSRYL